MPSKEILNHNNIHRYLVPILYILIWTSSLFVGIAGFLPKSDTLTEGYIITGWSIYTIFILDSLVYMIDMNSDNFEKQFGSNIFLFFASFIFLVALTIFSSWLFQKYEDYVWLIVMFAGMAFSKACLSFFANNIDMFFYKKRGEILYSTY